MSFNVQIKDYQIIKKAALDFIPGLNVIVGPSNNGKSSILKAIKALLYTTPGTSPIRAGQSSYMVGINYNGHTVILQKSLKESVYVVDGEKYTKFGTTTPDVVSKSVNIKELTLNGNKEHLNFWEQMEYPFLLDKTPVELFRFVIDSGDDDQITKALKNLVSERQSISKNIDQLQGSINTIDAEIQEFEDTLNAAEPKIQVCNKVLELQSKVARLNLLKDIRKQISNIQSTLVQVNADCIKVNRELEVCDLYLEKFNTLKNKCDLFKDMFSNLHLTIGDLSDVQENINTKSKLVSLFDINTDKLKLLSSIKGNYTSLSDRLNLIKIKPVFEFNIQRDEIIRLDVLKGLKKDSGANLDKLNSIVIKPVVGFDTTVFNKLNELKAISKKIDDLNYSCVNIETSKIAFSTVIETNDEIKKLIDVCPLCGHKLN